MSDRAHTLVKQYSSLQGTQLIDLSVHANLPRVIILALQIIFAFLFTSSIRITRTISEDNGKTEGINIRKFRSTY